MFYRPVDPWYITQHFGEDLAYTNGTVTIGVNPGDQIPEGFYKQYKNGHQGIDLRIKKWQPIYSASEGIVSYVQTDPAKGLGVVVDSIIEGKKWQNRYWHLIALNVNVGEKVKVGSFLGYGDNTGNSSGDHLHFTTAQWDGKKYVFQNPEPLMFKDFALKISLMTQVLEKLAQLFDLLSDKARGQSL